MEKQFEVCENLLWHTNFRQNHQGQSSKVCGHVVSNRMHHGTSHRIFHHQQSGDLVLYHVSSLDKQEILRDGIWFSVSDIVWRRGQGAPVISSWYFKQNSYNKMIICIYIIYVSRKMWVYAMFYLMSELWTDTKIIKNRLYEYVK